MHKTMKFSKYNYFLLFRPIKNMLNSLISIGFTDRQRRSRFDGYVWLGNKFAINAIFKSISFCPFLNISDQYLNLTEPFT